MHSDVTFKEKAMKSPMLYKNQLLNTGLVLPSYSLYPAFSFIIKGLDWLLIHDIKK